MSSHDFYRIYTLMLGQYFHNSSPVWSRIAGQRQTWMWARSSLLFNLSGPKIVTSFTTYFRTCSCAFFQTEWLESQTFASPYLLSVLSFLASAVCSIPQKSFCPWGPWSFLFIHNALTLAYSRKSTCLFYDLWNTYQSVCRNDNHFHPLFSPVFHLRTLHPGLFISRALVFDSASDLETGTLSGR